jgi:crossover junction endodeoxyribonuclease RuvC
MKAPPLPQDGKSSMPRRLARGERILGIDPGLQITGYGVIEAAERGAVVCEAGIIRGAEGGALPELAPRVRSVYDSIVDVIKQFRPGVVVVEQLYAHYQHPRTAILMAHARGVIFLAAAQFELPVVSYNATRIKKTVTGNGRAPKDQVQRTIQRELGLAEVPEPPDVADALAAALCHYHALALPDGERS